MTGAFVYSPSLENAIPVSCILEGMSKTTLRGSGALFLIVGVAAVLGAGMLIKNEKGVPYTEEVYNMVHFFVVGRGEDAMKKAEDAKQKLQERDAEIQRELDAQ